MRKMIRINPDGVDLTCALGWPALRKANLKSKTSLETWICRNLDLQKLGFAWSFDSNIRKSASHAGMQMLESDH
jgi:hypothetical protein